ncbi:MULTISPECIES: transposase family protein [unclassified Streptomyces]|uniref:transposase family protein n=1 Tax=unclassified Streptomyces TaxID=2593676 RepID=UPI0009A0D8F5|nr:transposase family protein [Streptomyces sp. TSRI0281]
MRNVNLLVSTVFSGLAAVVIEEVSDDVDAVLVAARTRGAPVSCPLCGTPTAKVHAYHRRTVADLPVDGRRVLVRLCVWRLVCPVVGCPRQTFREQIPGRWNPSVSNGTTDGPDIRGGTGVMRSCSRSSRPRRYTGDIWAGAKARLECDSERSTPFPTAHGDQVCFES